MEKWILAVILGWGIAACAPVRQHDSAWGTAGEVALRVVGCPLTLCFSEVGLAIDHERAQRNAAYEAWYQGLSPEEKDREARREAARLQALGFALSGGGPFQRTIAPSPVYVPYESFNPRPRVSCTGVGMDPFSQVTCN